MLILSEFLDDNAHKSYPFAIINELPTDFIVDAKFMVTGNIGKSDLYIDYIELTDTHIRIYMAAKLDGNIVNIGRILTCTISKERNIEHSCKLINDDLEIIIEGFITFGTFESLPKNKNIITLSDSGNIFSGCILPVTEWCTGIKINDHIYTGIVNLSASEGITFDTVQNEDSVDVIVKYTGFNRPADLTIDTMSDAEVLQEVTKLWGVPVTSISGVKPNNDGNITIDVDPSSDSYIEITPGVSTLTISDTYISACGVTDSDMDRMLQNISIINERSGKLETLTQQLESQFNTLSHEIAKLQG